MEGVRGCCQNGERCRPPGSSECTRPGWAACKSRDDMCAPPGADCCTDMFRYCPAGQQCYNSWCCPGGKTPCHKCEVRGRDECGDGCMPRGAVCCGQGYYCLTGQTCVGTSRCRESTGGGVEADVAQVSAVVVVAAEEAEEAAGTSRLRLR